ncbi:MAG TPA: SprT family zinc-dependent metalloprotease [Fervidobacterium sp.]|nr:M48 family peptidase [Fervidobacterium sp.]HOK87542.1 SprT family zinc-dependent metalloprotease [Fervidobacterium sp.]HOM73740.1 SprT family zinc-dependent metalloprotease [Fervidobacterium sp.]HOQ39187.1 SprT family zinc-dependent metalloprotease [Fervidobacterium sp.]HPP17517.1 SprT family zinc-dependent metalloprotease [Fervidobacterium sp.]
MKLEFQYGTKRIEFNLEYRKRKTVGISIEAPDVVNVAAPDGMKEDDVLETVKKKASWIMQKLFLLNSVETTPVKREYVNGESFMYFGRNYSLQIIVDENVKKPEVRLFRGKFCVTVNKKDDALIKKTMEEWYRRKTYEKVEERLEYYQRFFTKKPNAIKVKEQKKRWASCTSKDELLFNWRCAMARADAFDYILVHEMCHLYHKNHSKDFWNLVAKVMPDYEKRREWLKKYGVRMDL